MFLSSFVAILCYFIICILSGFPCEMDFSYHKSTNLTREVGIRRRVVRNPYHMENHTKCIFSHILHSKTL